MRNSITRDALNYHRISRDTYAASMKSEISHHLSQLLDSIIEADKAALLS